MQFRGQRTPPLSELDIWTLWKYGGERKKRKNSGNKEKVGRKKVGGHFPINIQIMIVLAFYDNGYCIYRECFGPLYLKPFLATVLFTVGHFQHVFGVFPGMFFQKGGSTFFSNSLALLDSLYVNPVFPTGPAVVCLSNTFLYCFITLYFL